MVVMYRCNSSCFIPVRLCKDEERLENMLRHNLWVSNLKWCPLPRDLDAGLGHGERLQLRLAKVGEGGSGEGEHPQGGGRPARVGDQVEEEEEVLALRLDQLVALVAHSQRSHQTCDPSPT